MANIPKVDSEDETTYGSGHGAFYMAQNRDNQAPVHVGSSYVGSSVTVPIASAPESSSEVAPRKRRNCCACWAVGFRTQTWINVAYNLFLNMVFGTFCWPFFTALAILGCVLLPFCGLGIPVLLGMLHLARMLASADVGLSNVGQPKSKRAYRATDNFLHVNQSFRGWARSVGCSCQSYSDFFFLWLCKMPIAWFGFFVVVLCTIGSGALLSAPIVFWSCDDCFKNGNFCVGNGYGEWSKDGGCDGWRVDTIQDAFGLCALGVLATIISLQISNGCAYISRELTRCALATDARGEGMNTHLLSGAHGTGGVSQPVGEEDYCHCDHSKTSTSAPKGSQRPPVVVIIDDSKAGSK